MKLHVLSLCSLLVVENFYSQKFTLNSIPLRGKSTSLQQVCAVIGEISQWTNGSLIFPKPFCMAKVIRPNLCCLKNVKRLARHVFICHFNPLITSASRGIVYSQIGSIVLAGNLGPPNPLEVDDNEPICHVRCSQGCLWIGWMCCFGSAVFLKKSKNMWYLVVIACLQMTQISMYDLEILTFGVDQFYIQL